MKNLILFMILFTGIIKVQGSPNPANADLELIRAKVKAEMMAQPVDEPAVRALIATILPDGTWPGINYKDVSNTGFQHRVHLGNMVKMALAFEKKGSKLKGDAKLKKSIYSALNYWIPNDFICDNWWWNQIGTPNELISLLMIMDTDLTKEQVAKILPMIGRANLTATGARPSGDRIKIAGILAKTLLYKRDVEQFNEVIKVIEGEIKFATGRGMQYDYSFHHREDKVNNTTSYGMGYADAFAEWASLVAGTKYKFSDPALHQLTDYYLDGICKQLIFGKSPDPGAKNRDITRFDGEKILGSAPLERLLTATDYRKKEMEEIIKLRKGEPGVPSSFSTFFWQSEHFTIQRPDFFTSVRMYSTRDCNMESPYNGEGLVNHFRGDGTNYISKSGREYEDLAPMNDWQKIPGTTIVQKPVMPSEKEIQKWGLTDFVGAATDGKYGVVAFDFKSPHDPLVAKKSWFFFDHEYVCLGAGITATTDLPVATTLNQCLLLSYVVVMSDNKKAVIDRGERKMSNVNWVLHDGVGYFFPKPTDVNMMNNAKSGSWYKINHQMDSPREESSREVFKLWIDHGPRPQNAVYTYIVIPNTTEKEMENQPCKEISILSNSPEIQAVKHSGLNLSEIIFYTSGEIQVSEGLKIGMDSPGAMMAKTEGHAIKQITVSDPSRKLGKIHLTVTGKIEKTGANYKSVWNNQKQISEISIDLPQTVYAGKSVTIEL